MGLIKVNSSFNLNYHQTDIDKIYLYAKDPYEVKYHFPVNKRESTGLKHFNYSKTFIEYSNDMNDIYKNTEEYNPNKKRKILTKKDFSVKGKRCPSNFAEYLQNISNIKTDKRKRNWNINS